MRQTFDFSIKECACTYGAPMGRHSGMDRNTEETLRARRLPLDRGGYDAGGAYWGLGSPMYVIAGSDGSRCYERARDRKELKATLAERFPLAKLAGFPKA